MESARDRLEGKTVEVVDCREFNIILESEGGERFRIQASSMEEEPDDVVIPFLKVTGDEE